MTEFQKFDARKLAAESRNQASLKLGQAEVSRARAEAQRAQSDARQKMGQAKRFQGNQFIAKMKVNQAKNLANRPDAGGGK